MRASTTVCRFGRSRSLSWLFSSWLCRLALERSDPAGVHHGPDGERDRHESRTGRNSGSVPAEIWGASGNSATRVPRQWRVGTTSRRDDLHAFVSFRDRGGVEPSAEARCSRSDASGTAQARIAERAVFRIRSRRMWCGASFSDTRPGARRQGAVRRRQPFCPRSGQGGSGPLFRTGKRNPAEVGRPDPSRRNLRGRAGTTRGRIAGGAGFAVRSHQIVITDRRWPQDVGQA